MTAWHGPDSGSSEGIRPPLSDGSCTTSLRAPDPVASARAPMPIAPGGLLASGPARHAVVRALQDQLKFAWASSLPRLPQAERVREAGRLVRCIERLHGKPHQTANALEIARLLLACPAVRDALAAEAQAQNSACVVDAVLFEAIGLLNLGELAAPVALYLERGCACALALQHFAARSARAAKLIELYRLASAQVQGLVAQSHAPRPAPRPLAAQLLDLSERVAAQLTQRPHRRARTQLQVHQMLQADNARRLFAPLLLRALARVLTAQKLRLNR